MGKNSRQLTRVPSAGIMNAFGQESKNINICCSSGQFSLEFLRVIVTVFV
jgi:hypothetical protein